MPQTSRSARHRGHAAICAQIHGIPAAALADRCRFCVLGGTRQSQNLPPPARQAPTVGIAVDPIRNLVAVARRYAELQDDAGEKDGVLVFDRLAAGDVPPRAIIRGPNTRITRLRQIEVDPERGLLFAASRGDREGEGILGVWNITDNGDVPPKFVISTAASGVAINPRNAEIYTVSGRTNDLRTYVIPHLFTSRP